MSESLDTALASLGMGGPGAAGAGPSRPGASDRGEEPEGWGAGRGGEGIVPGRRGAARALATVFSGWEAAVGNPLARHAQPLRLDGDVLVVAVDRPAWATQVRALAPEILERLSAAAGATFDRLEVVVRPT